MTAKRAHEEAKLKYNVLTSSWPRLLRFVDGMPGIVGREKHDCKIYIRVVLELLNDCSALIWFLMKNYRREFQP